MLEIKCPSCGAGVGWHAVRAQSFCPHCKQGFALRPWYFRIHYFAALTITGLLAYALGLRGDTLFFTTFLLTWPAFIVVLRIGVRLFPPDADPTGDVHGILWGVPRDDEGDLGEPDDDDVSSQERVRLEISAPTRVRNLLDLGREPRSIEGVALQGAALLLVVFAIWSALQPLTDRLFPEFDATRSGPAVFPITIHIGRDALQVTNGSEEPWSCLLTLGVFEKYRATLTVAAHQMGEIPHTSLEPRPDSAGEVRRLAREKIRVTCGDRRTSHFWIF